MESFCSRLSPPLFEAGTRCSPLFYLQIACTGKGKPVVTLPAKNDGCRLRENLTAFLPRGLWFVPEHLSVISSTRALSEPAQWQGNDRVAGGQMSPWEEHKVGSRDAGLAFPGSLPPRGGIFGAKNGPATPGRAHTPGLRRGEDPGQTLE